MKKLTIFIFSIGLAFWAGVSVVRAALSFGSGTYVNLCGSGTAATSYTCDSGCNPGLGKCEGDNNGVVKWTCSGKWIQCVEAESEWGNVQEIGNVACGKTVQISSFDKKCRLGDGAWDSSCTLLGYMVWYSGDCGSASGASPTPPQASSPTVTPRTTVAPTIRVSPSPTVRPTATPQPQVTGTVAPTQTSKFNTPTPTKRVTASPSSTAVVVCNKKCKETADCGAGFACEAGICRNPACPSDNTCFCGSVKGATVSGTTPQTGAEDWILIAGLVLAVVGGVMMKRAAVKLW